MITSQLQMGIGTWSTERIWRRRFTFLTSLMTLALIYAGGLVTSHGAGLSVPDWPTTYGENMFTYPISKWVGGIYYEHSHRLLASAVGLLILVQAFWIGSRDRRLRGVAYGALVAVIAQGALGGLTVLLGLSPTISVLHGVLGQTLFALTVYIAYSQSREREARLAGDELDSKSRFAIGRAALITTAIVYLQLIIGAVMRHHHAGLAVPDFPLMGGSLVPIPGDAMVAAVNKMRFALMFDPVTKGQVIVHIAHRLGAIVVIAGALWLNVEAYRVARGDRRIMRHISVFNALVFLQAGLGAFTIWSQKNPIVTSMHVVIGAALLGWSSLLVLRARPVTASPLDGVVNPNTSGRASTRPVIMENA